MAVTPNPGRWYKSEDTLQSLILLFGFISDQNGLSGSFTLPAFVHSFKKPEEIQRTSPLFDVNREGKKLGARNKFEAGTFPPLFVAS